MRGRLWCGHKAYFPRSNYIIMFSRRPVSSCCLGGYYFVKNIHFYYANDKKGMEGLFIKLFIFRHLGRGIIKKSEVNLMEMRWMDAYETALKRETVFLRRELKSITISWLFLSLFFLEWIEMQKRSSFVLCVTLFFLPLLLGRVEIPRKGRAAFKRGLLTQHNNIMCINNIQKKLRLSEQQTFSVVLIFWAGWISKRQTRGYCNIMMEYKKPTTLFVRRVASLLKWPQYCYAVYSFVLRFCSYVWFSQEDEWSEMFCFLVFSYFFFTSTFEMQHE